MSDIEDEADEIIDEEKEIGSGSESEEEDEDMIDNPLDLEDYEDTPIKKTETITVIRDPAKRITSNRMYPLEFTRLISTRAAQIDRCGDIYADPEGRTSSPTIAVNELRKGRCPLNVRREIAPGLFEEFSANEMVGWEDYAQKIDVIPKETQAPEVQV